MSSVTCFTPSLCVYVCVNYIVSPSDPVSNPGYVLSYQASPTTHLPDRYSRTHTHTSEHGVCVSWGLCIDCLRSTQMIRGKVWILDRILPRRVKKRERLDGAKWECDCLGVKLRVGLRVWLFEGVAVWGCGCLRAGLTVWLFEGRVEGVAVWNADCLKA